MMTADICTEKSTNGNVRGCLLIVSMPDTNSHLASVGTGRSGRFDLNALLRGAPSHAVAHYGLLVMSLRLCMVVFRMVNTNAYSNHVCHKKRLKEQNMQDNVITKKKQKSG